MIFIVNVIYTVFAVVVVFDVNVVGYVTLNFVLRLRLMEVEFG